MNLFGVNLDEKLSQFKQNLNARAAMQGMLKQLLPMLLSDAPAIIPEIETSILKHFEKVEKPSADGGLLTDGSEMIIYTLSRVDGQLFVAQCPAFFDDQNHLVVNEPIFAAPAQAFALQLIEAMKTANPQNTNNHE